LLSSLGMMRPISAGIFAVNCIGLGLVFVLGGACSSESSTSQDAGGTGGHSAGTGGSSGAGGVVVTGTGGAVVTGTGGSGVCAAAVVNGACSAENTTCNQGCSDACSFCNSLRCSGGHWVQQEAFPAPCFDCGPTLRCRIGQQDCIKTEGGAVGSPPSYVCSALPDQCLATPTCACVAPPPALCAESGTGQLTITNQVP
jgi:hypothetical protein